MKDTIEVHLTGYVLKDVGPKDFYDTSRGVYIYERNDAGELRTEEFYPWARVKKIVKHYGTDKTYEDRNPYKTQPTPKADPSYVQLLVSGEDHFETVVKHPGTGPHAHDLLTGSTEVVEF